MGDHAKWVPATDDEFGEDPIPLFAANVPSARGPVRAGEKMCFDRATAKDLRFWSALGECC